jgi:hypothetical protein
MMNSNVGRLANLGLHHGFPVFLPQMLVPTSLAISSKLMTLARFRRGRILLHLLAMLGDRCIRFHVAGIVRELPGAAG